MIRRKSLALGIAAIAVATAAVVPFCVSTRGVRVLPLETEEVPAAFDPQQSVALFLGVRHFTAERAIDVPYAVDDAIDLAYMFTLDKGVCMVDPRRVILAISGKPEKEESKKRLTELERLGVRITRAVEADDILRLVREQANRVERGGIYVLSLATHGFLHRGTPYVLGSSSRMRDPGTSVSAAEIADIIGSSKARRSLLFIDACRVRVPARGGSEKPLEASFINRMKRIRGQVIFAAANGNDTYDDLGNGVFTRAVIDGLQCEAAATRGIVTVANLHAFVEREVRAWIREHRDESLERATFVSMEGETRNMPLARCAGAPSIVAAAADGVNVKAFAADKAVLWTASAGAVVSEARLADLDGDSEREVVTATANGIVAFDHDGKRLWSYDSQGPPRALAIGPYYRLNTYIAALFATRLVTIDEDGRELSKLDSDSIRSVAIYRPTSQYGPKVVAASDRTILILDPTKIAKTPLFGASVNDTIETVSIRDRDDDRRWEIELTLRGGGGYVIEFKPRRAHRVPNTKADIHLLPPKPQVTAADILGR